MNFEKSGDTRIDLLFALLSNFLNKKLVMRSWSGEFLFGSFWTINFISFEVI